MNEVVNENQTPVTQIVYTGPRDLERPTQRIDDETPWLEQAKELGYLLVTSNKLVINQRRCPKCPEGMPALSTAADHDAVHKWYAYCERMQVPFVLIWQWRGGGGLIYLDARPMDHWIIDETQNGDSYILLGRITKWLGDLNAAHRKRRPLYSLWWHDGGCSGMGDLCRALRVNLLDGDVVVYGKLIAEGNFWRFPTSGDRPSPWRRVKPSGDIPVGAVIQQ